MSWPGSRQRAEDYPTRRLNNAPVIQVAVDRLCRHSTGSSGSDRLDGTTVIERPSVPLSGPRGILGGLLLVLAIRVLGWERWTTVLKMFKEAVGE